jgi:hypothetical protein
MKPAKGLAPHRKARLIAGFLLPVDQGLLARLVLRG